MVPVADATWLFGALTLTKKGIFCTASVLLQAVLPFVTPAAHVDTGMFVVAPSVEDPTYIFVAALLTATAITVHFLAPALTLMGLVFGYSVFGSTVDGLLRRWWLPPPLA